MLLDRWKASVLFNPTVPDGVELELGWLTDTCCRGYLQWDLMHVEVVCFLQDHWFLMFPAAVLTWHFLLISHLSVKGCACVQTCALQCVQFFTKVQACPACWHSSICHLICWHCFQLPSEMMAKWLKQKSNWNSENAMNPVNMSCSAAESNWCSPVLGLHLCQIFQCGTGFSSVAWFFQGRLNFSGN